MENIASTIIESAQDLLASQSASSTAVATTGADQSEGRQLRLAGAKRFNRRKALAQAQGLAAGSNAMMVGAGSQREFSRKVQENVDFLSLKNSQKFFLF